MIQSLDSNECLKLLTYKTVWEILEFDEDGSTAVVVIGLLKSLIAQKVGHIRV